MLGQLADRGPDSRRARALPRPGAARARRKLTLFSADPDEDWPRGSATPTVRASHAVVVLDGDAEAEARVRARAARPARDERRRADRDLQGGRPTRARSSSASRWPEMRGSHGARAHAHGDGEPGHDRGRAPVLHRPRPLPGAQRLALEPQPAAPAAAPRGHRVPDRERHRGRRRLPRPGGCARATTLEQALEGCLDDLDGFYTFAVGTADGFAVLRDPIACKPAVLAETDDWVAMASEYRAIAVLPGAEDAAVWEPAPARVYSWERAPRLRETVAGARRGRRPRRHAAARAQPAAARRAPAPRWRVVHPERRARRGGRASTPTSRSTSTATSATTAPA